MLIENRFSFVIKEQSSGAFDCADIPGPKTIGELWEPQGNSLTAPFRITMYHPFGSVPIPRFEYRWHGKATSGQFLSAVSEYVREYVPPEEIDVAIHDGQTTINTGMGGRFTHVPNGTQTLLFAETTLADPEKTQELVGSTNPSLPVEMIRDGIYDVKNSLQSSSNQ